MKILRYPAKLVLILCLVFAGFYLSGCSSKQVRKPAFTGNKREIKYMQCIVQLNKEGIKQNLIRGICQDILKR